MNKELVNPFDPECSPTKPESPDRLRIRELEAELARVRAEAAAMREAIQMRHKLRDAHTAEELVAAYRAELSAISSTAGRDLLERLERAEAILRRIQSEVWLKRDIAEQVQAALKGAALAAMKEGVK